MRIKVLQPTLNRCFSLEEQQTGVWSRLSGIRSGVTSICLWQRRFEGMMPKRIGVLKFHLRLVKLSQVRLHRGTYEFCPHLYLAGVGIIYHSSSVLASPKQRSLQNMVTSIFCSTSTTFRRYHGLFKLFSTQVLLHRRPRGDIEFYSRRAIEGCRRKMVILCVIVTCKVVLVRAGFR